MKWMDRFLLEHERVLISSPGACEVVEWKKRRVTATGIDPPRRRQWILRLIVFCAATLVACSAVAATLLLV